MEIFLMVTLLILGIVIGVTGICITLWYVKGGKLSELFFPMFKSRISIMNYILLASSIAASSIILISFPDLKEIAAGIWVACISLYGEYFLLKYFRKPAQNTDVKK